MRVQRVFLPVVAILAILIAPMAGKNRLTLFAEAEQASKVVPSANPLPHPFPGITMRVSVASDGTQGNSCSGRPSISADGRYVAFCSAASNLVEGDTNDTDDVFIHDRETGQTERVSIASDSTEGNGRSYLASISADGRYVVFSSTASNLVPDDTNGKADIFVHDRITGQTDRVSIASDGTEGNDDSWGFSSISADGRYIAFESKASNLVPGDTNGREDVFVYNQRTGETIRVSIASDGTEGKGFVANPSISADGRFVAFASSSSNLVPDDTNGHWDIFVHDRETDQTTRVSVASDGIEGNEISEWPSISVDGRYVAFQSRASNLVPGGIHCYIDAFVHDRETHQTERISIAPDGIGGDFDGYPSISGNGRYVTFCSVNDLIPDDTNGTYDIFVHDRPRGQTSRISVASDGAEGNGPSKFQSSISFDGRYVAFYSWANNLVPGDTNNEADVFVHDRGWSEPTPFLDLPIVYTNFAQAAQGNVNGQGPGRVNSWLDHTYPNYGTNKNLTRWDGRIFDFSVSPPQQGVSWYDGHDGIDFSRGGQNEQIFAAAPGVVFKTVTWCEEGDKLCGGGYGNQVWIDHGNGYATLYGHLKTVYVTPDTQITDPASQPLGIMGNTGDSTGTHLHFALYYDQNGDGQWSSNEVVDPYGWSGTGADPWGVPSRYLWKHPLWAQTTAGISGTTISSPSGNVNATIPPEALTSMVTLELWDTPPVAEPWAQLRSTGRSFWLRVLEWLIGSRDGVGRMATSGFEQPVTMTVTYATTDVLHLDPTQLTVYRWDDAISAWVALSTTVDTDQHQAIAQTMEIGSFDLQAPLLCPADAREPDDTYDAAGPIPVDGIPVGRLFDISEDEDWFRLEAVAGAVYTLQTQNLAAGVETVLSIYDLDGLTLLASDDNSGGGKASRLEWRAPKTGTYFVRVTPASGSAYGCTATYEVVAIVRYQIYLPLVFKNR